MNTWPKNVKAYAKFIVAIVAAGLASAEVVFADAPGVMKGLVVATSMVGAAGVLLAKNEPEGGDSTEG